MVMSHGLLRKREAPEKLFWKGGQYEELSLTEQEMNERMRIGESPPPLHVLRMMNHWSCICAYTKNKLTFNVVIFLMKTTLFAKYIF